MPEAALTDLIAATLQHQGQALSAETFLEQIIDVSELIVRQGLEGCEFAHLSFQEFLAAAQVKDLNQESLLYSHLQDADTDLDAEKDDRAWWRQTILLYAAQITKPTTLIEEALRQRAVDLAYACYQETQRALEDGLIAEIEALKPQIQILRYAKLEKLLKAQQWREADDETYRLMINSVDKEKGQMLDLEDLKSFPCEDLKAIDELWLKYSGGKFGFSMQKQIWQECNSPMTSDWDWERFCIKVGWRDSNSNNLKYRNFKANPDLSPAGELPFLFYSFTERSWVSVFWVCSLLARRDLLHGK